MSQCLKVGDKINNYEILKVLGKTEYTTVYLAIDEVLLRKWIIKEIQDPSLHGYNLHKFRENFISTCKHLSNLKNNATNRIVDYFIVEDRRFYLVREFLEGRFLTEIIKKNQAPIQEVNMKDWFTQILEIFDLLHSQKPPITMGIIVPKNIMVSAMGRIKIMDFGVHRFFPPDKQLKMFQEINSKSMAPELLKNKQKPDIRSDIYSIAALFYYFLSGNEPECCDISADSLKEIRPDISSPIIEAIAKGLSSDPKERFSSVREFKAGILGPDEKKQGVKVQCNVEEIAMEDAPESQLLNGNFMVQNVGQGLLRATVAPEYAWIKVHPEEFTANQQEIKYWVDTSYMEPGNTYENIIQIKTDEEIIDLPITISIAPVKIQSIKPLNAFLFILLIPLTFVALGEFFRIFLIQISWEQFLQKYNLLREGINYAVTHKSYLIPKMYFEPKYVFFNKVYAIFAITIPFLSPLFVEKLYSSFNEDTRDSLKFWVAVVMLLPSILLVASLYYNNIPAHITANSYVKYLNPARYLISSIIINIFTTIIMLLPAKPGKGNIPEENVLLKTFFNTLFALYFLTVIVLLVIL